MSSKGTILNNQTDKTVQRSAKKKNYYTLFKSRSCQEDAKKSDMKKMTGTFSRGQPLTMSHKSRFKKISPQIAESSEKFSTFN